MSRVMCGCSRDCGVKTFAVLFSVLLVSFNTALLALSVTDSNNRAVVLIGIVAFFVDAACIVQLCCVGVFNCR